MMKNLLLTGLLSTVFLSTYAEGDQQKCVRNFMAQVFSGKVIQYNDICSCFSASSVNDLSDQQIKQVIQAAVKASGTSMPYANYRFVNPLIGKESIERVAQFIHHIDAQRPLLGIINDLYLKDRISRENKNKALQRKMAVDSIGMLDKYIAIIENKNELPVHPCKGVLDNLVVDPKNLEQLKIMRQELKQQYAGLTKNKVSARTPWVQECLDTIESYEPYLSYAHNSSEEYRPHDLKPLMTSVVTSENIKTLSYREFFVLAKAVIKARNLMPEFFFGGPDEQQSQVSDFCDLILDSKRSIISSIIAMYLLIRY